MNFKKLFLLLLLISSSLSLAQKVSGQILNESDKTPIFGVTIYNNDVPIVFSDQEGYFEIADSLKLEELTFSHFAYLEKKIRLSEFLQSKKIFLQEKTNMLNEVVVSATRNLTLKEILKKSEEVYKTEIKQSPYITKVDAKQVIFLNSERMGFLEVDGFLYNFIPKNKNPFLTPQILLKNYRKNTENKNFSSDYASKNKHPYNSVSADVLQATLQDYQFLNLSHPLTKNHKYSYKLLENEFVLNKDCFHIQFFQKKGINIKRDLFNIYGEMWIDSNDYSILKYNVSFDFDDIRTNNFELTYEKKANDVFIKTMTTKTIIINRKYKKKGVMVASYFDFDNSKIIDTKEITNLFNINYYLDELNYNANYWYQIRTSSSTKLIDDYLKKLTPTDFEEGSKQKLLDTKSKYYTDWHEEFRIQQIKLHKEALNNIKL